MQNRNTNNAKMTIAIGLIYAAIIIGGVGLWAWNGVKLASCDFESDYKCEAIHGVGLVIPPTSVITVWFGDDND